MSIYDFDFDLFGLSQFGFRAIWSPGVLLGFILVGIIYLWIAGNASKQFGGKPASLKQKVLFMTGLVLLYLCQGGPLNLLAHLMFTAHMVVMAISFIVVPPLIILGLPKWLWEKWTQLKIVQAVSHIFHPIVTALTFNMLFSFYHIPFIHDFVMTHYVVHVIYYIVMFAAALLMYAPIFSTIIPQRYELTDVKKMGYIFLNGVLLTPACALIIFADKPLFDVFNDPNTWALALGYCVPGGSTVILDSFSGPSMFQFFSPQEDQQLGGIVMKLFQEVVYGSILAYVFFHWFKNENPKGSEDLNPQFSN